MEVVRSNDMLNHCIVDGRFTAQHYNIELGLKRLNVYLNGQGIEPKHIIEIGTYRGGFTTLLSKHPISDNATIHSFDIDSAIGQRQIGNSLDNVIFYEEDVFSTETIKNIIESNDNCLVFCDGGNKIDEFNHFSQFLKKNDMIFAHDYAWDINTFETKIKGKIWDYCEVFYADIEDAVKKHKLKAVLPKAFEEIVWASFIKQ
jgi:hypothetical protein